jgi:serine/threonine protein kinase
VWQANILINSVGRACLADFGLSTIDAITDQSYEIMKSTTTIPKVGTFRWLAPELLEPEDDGSGNRYQPTPATDIYALGIVAYEVSRGVCCP